MKQLPDYSLIDQNATGARLKSLIRSSGYRVSEVQEFLSFSGPQPIYRWFRGEALPSLHHLCALSGLLDVPVDALLVREHVAGSICMADYDCTADRDQVEMSEHAESHTCTECHARAKSSNCYRLSSEVTENACGSADTEPLRIDFERCGKNRHSEYATGTYGIALLARRCTNVKRG